MEKQIHIAVFCQNTILTLLITLSGIVPNGLFAQLGDTLAAHDHYLFGKGLKDSASYREALHAFRASAVAFENAGAHIRQIDALNELASCYRILRESDSAKYFLEQALSAAEASRLGVHLSVANSHYYLATVWYQRKKYDRARQEIKKGLDITRELLGERDPELGAFYLLDGVIHKKEGHYQKALLLYEQARSLYMLDSAQHVGVLATIYNNQANIYKLQSDYSKALRAYQHSLMLDKARFPADHPKIGNTYHNMSNLYRRWADFQLARQYEEKSLQIEQRRFGPMHMELYDNYYSLSLLSRYEGNYDQAIGYANKALQILDQQEENVIGERAMCLNALGNAWGEKRDYEQDLYFQLEALKQHQSSPLTAPLDVAIDYSNIGHALMHLDRYEESRKAYLEALKYRREIHGDLHPMVAKMYFNLSALELDRGNHEQLLQLHRKGKSILEQSGGELPVSYSKNLAEVGYSYLKREEAKKALDYFQDALRVLIPGFEPAYLGENPREAISHSDEDYLDVMNGKAIAYHQLYSQSREIAYLDTALEAIGAGIQMVEDFRRRYLSQQMQVFLVGRAHKLFEVGIEIAFEAYQEQRQSRYLERAFAISEKSKSFLLLSSTRSREAMHYASIPQALIKKERELKLELGFVKKKVLEIDPDQEEEILRWKNRAFDLELARDSLIRMLEDEYPAYFQHSYSVSSPTIAQVQQTIENGKLLIEYCWGEQGLFAFWLTPNEANLIRLDTGLDSLQEDILKFRAFLSDQAKIEQEANSAVSIQAFVNQSTALFNVLLRPILEIVPAPPHSLTIVPDAHLHLLPFDILIHQDSLIGSFHYRSLPYLFRQFPITYAHSTSLLLQAQPSLFRARKIFAGFAPSFKDEMALYANFKEVSQTSKLLRGKSFLGSKATKAAFKKESPNYQILHLATHTFANNEHPSYSGMYFSPSTDSGEHEILETFEIYSLPLAAELAVLSGCHTGTGPLLKNEGILSLARAFRFTGCPSIIMSLWQVDDETSSLLMNHFYHHLKEGANKDVALQQAKLAVLEEARHPHPFYWAPFVLIGDHQALSAVQKDYSFFRWVGIAIMIVLSISLFLLGSSRKK